MSTLWTPRGEHQVPRPGADRRAGESEARQAPGPAGQGPPGSKHEETVSRRHRGDAAEGVSGAPTPEELEQAETEMEAVREQLLRAPAELVVANHAMGLWELGALHLSARPPQLAQARLAIDALTCLVDGLKGRLGEPETTLAEGAAQLRLAFVQVAGMQEGAEGSAGTAEA